MGAEVTLKRMGNSVRRGLQPHAKDIMVVTVAAYTNVHGYANVTNNYERQSGRAAHPEIQFRPRVYGHGVPGPTYSTEAIRQYGASADELLGI